LQLHKEKEKQHKLDKHSAKEPASYPIRKFGKNEKSDRKVYSHQLKDLTLKKLKTLLAEELLSQEKAFTREKLKKEHKEEADNKAEQELNSELYRIEIKIDLLKKEIKNREIEKTE
jgi:cytochrome c-type biogenesis protein CcmH/NrfG